MLSAISLVGLLLSSASAFWLLIADIRERTKRRKRLDEIAALMHQIAVHKKNLKLTIANVAEVNAKLGHEAYDVERETLKTRTYRQELENKLDELNDPDQAVLESMLPLSHLGAFILLLLGFLFQLLAEAIKALAEAKQNIH